MTLAGSAPAPTVMSTINRGISFRPIMSPPELMRG
jgi:hypothetical protein